MMGASIPNWYVHLSVQLLPSSVQPLAFGQRGCSCQAFSSRSAQNAKPSQHTEPHKALEPKRVQSAKPTREARDATAVYTFSFSVNDH